MISLTTINRSLSLIVAAFYLLIAYFSEKQAALIIKALIFLAFPLGCIWFGDILGNFTGLMRGQYINQTSPGWLVSAGGWLILLGVPFLIFLMSQDL